MRVVLESLAFPPCRTSSWAAHVALAACLAACQTLPEDEGGGDATGAGPEADGTFGDDDPFDDGADDASGLDLPCGPSCDAFCDPWAQDCGPGEKCMPWSNDGDTTWNAVRCVGVADDPVGLSETCTAPDGGLTGQDDCDVGLMCWNVDAAGQGTCIGLCEGTIQSPGCADPAAVCSVYNDGALPVCLYECDPLAQTCPGDQLCIPQGGGGSTFVCAVDAAPVEGGYGDPCLAFNKCDPGLFCAPAETVPGCGATAGCCSEFCDLSDADPDAACSGHAQGQTCLPWFQGEGAPPGLETLGACGIAT
jgi:hypothetical protein